MLIQPGAHRYPTPWGELHVDQPLDEITLVRLIDGMRDCGLTPDLVLGAIVAATSIVFDYRDDPPQFHNDDPTGTRLRLHTIVATR